MTFKTIVKKNKYEIMPNFIVLKIRLQQRFQKIAF